MTAIRRARRLHPVRAKRPVRPGTTVLEAARRLGVDLDSVCGGRGICGRCQIEVAEGEHAKHGITSTASSLSPATAVEERYASDRGLVDGRRLGCTACVAGDVVIDVPPESQLYRQVVRKEADAHPIEIDPVVRLYYVEVAGAELGVAAGDLRRVRKALAAEWELDGLDADPATSSPNCSARSSRKGARSRSRFTTARRSRPRGRACTIARTGSPSTSARRPSRATCATSSLERCWPRPER